MPAMLWASHYPPAYAIRHASPRTRTLDVLYRTPVCFNTVTKEMAIGLVVGGWDPVRYSSARLSPFPLPRWFRLLTRIDNVPS